MYNVCSMDIGINSTRSIAEHELKHNLHVSRVVLSLIWLYKPLENTACALYLIYFKYGIIDKIPSYTPSPVVETSRDLSSAERRQPSTSNHSLFQASPAVMVSL
jgi:hypothetical protein